MEGVQITPSASQDETRVDMTITIKGLSIEDLRLFLNLKRKAERKKGRARKRLC